MAGFDPETGEIKLKDNYEMPETRRPPIDGTPELEEAEARRPQGSLPQLENDLVTIIAVHLRKLETEEEKNNVVHKVASLYERGSLHDDQGNINTSHLEGYLKTGQTEKANAPEDPNETIAAYAQALRGTEKLVAAQLDSLQATLDNLKAQYPDGIPAKAYDSIVKSMNEDPIYDVAMVPMMKEYGYTPMKKGDIEIGPEIKKIELFQENKALMELPETKPTLQLDLGNN